VERGAVIAAVLAALSACGDDSASSNPGRDAADHSDGAVTDGAPGPDALAPSCLPTAGTDLYLEPIAEGLINPLFVTSPPGDARLFVVEQGGTVRIVKDGVLLPEPFLDLRDRVLSEGNEQGLLGLAFHPDWARNHRLFVYYTADGGDPYIDLVAEYTASPDDPDRGDPDSERRVIQVLDPHLTHNGGMIAFGPDGYLYIGMGDGGGPGDPGNDAQDMTGLLGDMLRIDVDGGTPYDIPADNPHVGAGGGVREEIWLSGLRNPWRWSFDRVTGEMYVGDVGQSTREEIDLIPAGQGGLNLGWNVMEGDVCYSDPDCVDTGFHAPLLTYANEVGPPCHAVVGGYVYRGSCYPDLQGRYFFADFCTENVFEVEVVDGQVVSGPTDVRPDLDPDQILRGIASFGEDALGELYVVSRQDGLVFRIAAQP
jgi:glucose/arabinose dehydrogenase